MKTKIKLLSGIKTVGKTKEDYLLKRVRFFQLLSYISLIGNILFIICVLGLATKIYLLTR